VEFVQAVQLYPEYRFHYEWEAICGVCVRGMGMPEILDLAARIRFMYGYIYNL